MISLLIPDMPSAEDLKPFLERMSFTRIYCNNGPLVRSLEERLESILDAHVVMVSSGTTALNLALQATAKERNFNTVAMPALTFSATALAALQNDQKVYIKDVDPDTWMMTPHEGEVRTLLPVAVFGRPVDNKAWELAAVRSPIVVDAAGAFPAQPISKNMAITTCFSMHATKFFGCGEGGFVASSNKVAVDRIRDLANFGSYGTNAKMSEYHAAVAHAALNRLEEKTTRLHKVCRWFVKHGIEEFPNNIGYGVQTQLVVKVKDAARTAKVLKNARIESKQWYRPWLDERTEFFHEKRDLPNTAQLRNKLLGIPYHSFLTETDVIEIMKALFRANKQGE